MTAKEKNALKEWANRMAEAYTILKMESRTIYTEGGDELLLPCGEPSIIKKDYGVHLSRLDEGSSLLNLADALAIDRENIMQVEDGNREFFFVYKGLRFFELPETEDEDLFSFIYQEGM